jgi:predicted RNase H-like HicB family nuclease
MYMKHIHSVVWKEDKWYVAKALELEIASQGKTQKEALENLKEALELYFEGGTKIDLSPVQKPKLQDISIQVHGLNSILQNYF